MLRTPAALAAAATLMAVPAASATLISFASDDQHVSPTLRLFGTGAGQMSVTTAADTVNVVLVIDDENGPAPALRIPVRVTFAGTATHEATTTDGSLTSRRYALFGNLDVTATSATGNGVPSGTRLLTVTMDRPGTGRLFLVGGTSPVGAAGSIIASDNFQGVSYLVLNALITAAGGPAAAAAYGLVPGTSGAADDFAMTLTNVQNAGIGPPTIGPDGTLTGSVTAESSMSGRFVVPAPGNAAGLVLLLGATARRRRPTLPA